MQPWLEIGDFFPPFESISELSFFAVLAEARRFPGLLID